MASTETIDASTDEQFLADLLQDVSYRLQMGEQIELEELLQQYPAHADRLRDFLPLVQLMVQAGGDAAAREDAMFVLRSGSVVNDYRIIRELGRGGMGVVYEAEEISLGRSVALKVLPFLAVLGQRKLVRFQHEARAAGTLDHPNIVPVYSVGQDDGVHYFAMQLIEGQSLASVIGQLRRDRRLRDRQLGAPSRCSDECETRTDSGSLVGVPGVPPDSAQGDLEDTDAWEASPRTPPGGTPPIDCGHSSADQPSPTPSLEGRGTVETNSERQVPGHSHAVGRNAYFRDVARLGADVADALHHAHERGIIHRDIKPANLLLDRHGKVWVTDFGLARFRNDASVTQNGELVGTTAYMPSEQALGNRVVIDERADVYSLGVTLYEALMLEPAFEGTSHQELLKRISSQEPKLPRKIDRRIPAELEAIVLKAIEKERDDRYATVRELSDDLRRFLHHQPIRAKHASARQRIQKWCRRHPGPVVFSTVVVVLVMLASIVVAAVSLRAKDHIGKAFVAERDQRERAEEHLNLASNVLELATDQLAFQLQDIPHATELQMTILEEAIRFYDLFPEQDRNQPEILFAKARALRNLSDLYQLPGIATGAPPADHPASRALDEGLPLGDQALTIQRQLWEQHPDDPRFASELSRCYRNVASFIELTTHNHYPRPPGDLLEQAVATMRTAVKRAPDDQETQLELAAALMSLATHRHDRQGWHLYQKDLEQAALLYREAITVLKRQAAGNSGTRQMQQSLASAYVSLGGLFADEDGPDYRPQEAEDAFRKAIEIAEGLLDEIPFSQRACGVAAMAHEGLAGLLRAQTRMEEEERHFNQAITLQERLTNDFPNLPHHQLRLAEMSTRRAWFFLAKRMWPEARKAYRLAIEHSRSNFRPATYACRWAEYADILYEVGDVEASRNAYQEAIRIVRSAMKQQTPAAVNAACLAAFIQCKCPFPDLCDYEQALNELVDAVGEARVLEAPEGQNEQHHRFDDTDMVSSMVLFRTGRLQEANRKLSAKVSTQTQMYLEVDRRAWECRVLVELGETERASQLLDELRISAEMSNPRAGNHLVRERLLRECAELLAE